ncbi:N-acetylmuramidase domain-containing protein [Pseudomonas sp. MS15a(2019)]|uniref:N-acetylmuramidase domain-containing protein n=1 Tax=Pseudomonas sp. MS15a(2019) TaxID=2579938 RepID=UPI0015630D01|nr:N-acetylmuramidase domain-containing protein [Pseudomonas sp. MS15a(2019)]NRH42686.1 DUF3380 domain-containing protein [Pseudomonas sp. MS15a(2019)]
MTTHPIVPQPKVENWAYPFKAKGGQEVTDPQLYQQALAQARGGTYLLGSNGLWHGGVHFDEGTAAFLDQSRIHCIADGEVVAYRIDDKVHRFVPDAHTMSEGKTYSTSFVLVRHRLEAPQLADSDETPPSLVFFSLYMHLLDWAGYQADPALPRPVFWGNDRYRVRTQGGRLNVRQAPRSTAPVQAELDNGSRIRIAGNGAWCQIIEILDNGLTLRPGHTQVGLGYVARRYLKAEATPKVQNTVVVLDQPFPIKAGALLGHPGLYEGQQQIHLETFSCDDLPAFIERSRAWAARLPDSDKTLLKIHAGASKLITHRPDIDANHPPRISDPGLQVGVNLILSQAQLDARPAADKIVIPAQNIGGICTPEQRWWHLKGLLADAEENPIDGWLCEQEFITSRHSPWEWVDYETIQDSTAPRSRLAYKMSNLDLLTSDEKIHYSSEIIKGSQSPIIIKFRKLIDENEDRVLSDKELKKFLSKPWLAQKLQKTIALCDSEWNWDPEKWSFLDELLTAEAENENKEWENEKQKIKILSWWKQASSVESLSTLAKCWHIQGLDLKSHFLKRRIHPIVTVLGERVELDFLLKHQGKNLEDKDVREAAAELGCEPGLVYAIAKQESSHSSFIEIDGEKIPSILYERHHFKRLARNESLESSHQDIYGPPYRRAKKLKNGTYIDTKTLQQVQLIDTYGPSGRFQYERLIRAYRLNEDAALQASSWGKFQIMGFNYKAAGYETVKDFTKAMSKGDGEHIKAFLRFAKRNATLLRGLRTRHFETIAQGHNGKNWKEINPDYAKNIEKFYNEYNNN